MSKERENKRVADHPHKQQRLLELANALPRLATALVPIIDAYAGAGVPRPSIQIPAADAPVGIVAFAFGPDGQVVVVPKNTEPEDIADDRTALNPGSQIIIYDARMRELRRIRVRYEVKELICFRPAAVAVAVEAAAAASSSIASSASSSSSDFTSHSAPPSVSESPDSSAPAEPSASSAEPRDCGPEFSRQGGAVCLDAAPLAGSAYALDFWLAARVTKYALTDCVDESDHIILYSPQSPDAPRYVALGYDSGPKNLRTNARSTFLYFTNWQDAAYRMSLNNPLREMVYGAAHRLLDVQPAENGVYIVQEDLRDSPTWSSKRDRSVVLKQGRSVTTVHRELRMEHQDVLRVSPTGVVYALRGNVCLIYRDAKLVGQIEMGSEEWVYEHPTFVFDADGVCFASPGAHSITRYSH